MLTLPQTAPNHQTRPTIAELASFPGLAQLSVIVKLGKPGNEALAELCINFRNLFSSKMDSINVCKHQCLNFEKFYLESLIVFF